MLSLTVKKTLEQAQEQAMKTRFLRLCDALKLPKDTALERYKQLYSLYNQPNRYYHNLVHIWNFVKLFDQYKEKILQPLLFELAIWYHDAIYEAKKKDNELQSANLVQELFKNTLHEQQLNYVNDLIMSTEGHFPKTEQMDVYRFLDFDLAILATDYKTYQKYSEAIWQEYKTAYPKLLYKIGRKKVLKNFLSREKLYFSEEFFEKFEKKARQNIQLELNGA